MSGLIASRTYCLTGSIVAAVQVEISDTMKRHKKAGLKMGVSPTGMMAASHSSNPTPTMLVKKRDGEPPKIISYIPGMSDSMRLESGHTKSSAGKKRKGRSLCLPAAFVLGMVRLVWSLHACVQKSGMAQTRFSCRGEFEVQLCMQCVNCLRVISLYTQ